jgi:uncharacterized membrane protein YphA (DoxX/SURF4 family)
MIALPRSNKIASLLLRVALAGVFLYASIGSTLNPQEWIGFLPSFLTHIISGELLLKFFAIYEALLALWLLSGKFTQYAAGLSALTLAGIVVSNLSLLAISFRDAALACAAVGLFFIDPQK